MPRLLSDFFDGSSELSLVYLAVVEVVLAAAWILWRRLHRRREPDVVAPELDVDVTALPERGPPPGPPTLEFYNLPVRLAAVVLAPVGRVRTLPAREDLPGVVDSIVPGLDRVAVVHKPLIRAWPVQVSARGFAHAFFQHVGLPGDHGKKTPWCSVAGRFMVDDQPMMAGLVLRAAAPNRHGQYVIEREEQWLGILRIRLDA